MNRRVTSSEKRPVRLPNGFRFRLARLAAGVLLSVVACVTPYKPEKVPAVPRLVVEGLITDQPGPHTVRLTYSAAFAEGAAGANRSLDGARVYATDDAGGRIDFLDGGNGFYRTGAAVRGEAGRSYQLHIATPDGRTYRSEPDLLKPVPPIDSLYWEYDRASRSVTVYLDLTDPPTPGDGYYWKWRNYTSLRNSYCKFSDEVPGRNGERTYCRRCCTDCWQINQCYRCVDIAGDQYVNGNKIRRQPVATLVFEKRGGYYLLIEQRSLSANGYRFWNSVRAQSSAAGGPFDVPPAPTLGNIRNVADPKEKVLGFFGASAVILRPYWMDWGVINDMPSVPFDSAALCPTGPPPYPDCYPCTESITRTRIKPPGWDD